MCKSDREFSREGRLTYTTRKIGGWWQQGRGGSRRRRGEIESGIKAEALLKMASRKMLRVKEKRDEEKEKAESGHETEATSWHGTGWSNREQE